MTSTSRWRPWSSLFPELSHRVLLACKATGDDPCELIESAARKHIPVNPDLKDLNVGKPCTTVIPSSSERKSVAQILEDVKEQDWYVEQIVHHQTLEAKEGRKGMHVPYVPWLW